MDRGGASRRLSRRGEGPPVCWLAAPRSPFVTVPASGGNSGWTSGGREPTKQTVEHSAVECPRVAAFRARYPSSHHVGDLLRPPSNRRSGCGHLALACDENEPASASNRCARSSRIRPANDRETSRNGGNGWSIESAGQEPDSAIAAGSEFRPENTLKVETRVQIPLGLQARTCRSAPRCSGGELVERRLRRQRSREYPESDRA
jgi:hypothetical protein